MTEEQIEKGNAILKKMHAFAKLVNKGPFKIEPCDQSEPIWEEVVDFKSQAEKAWKDFSIEKLDHLQKELEAL